MNFKKIVDNTFKITYTHAKITDLLVDEHVIYFERLGGQFYFENMKELSKKLKEKYDAKFVCIAVKVHDRCEYLICFLYKSIHYKVSIKFNHYDEKEFQTSFTKCNKKFEFSTLITESRDADMFNGIIDDAFSFILKTEPFQEPSFRLLAVTGNYKDFYRKITKKQ
jgi:hypothetical protein